LAAGVVPRDIVAVAVIVCDAAGEKSPGA